MLQFNGTMLCHRVLKRKEMNGLTVQNGWAAALIRWYEQVKRDLPWRRTGDPYAVWISEIMLQQTRVEAVIAYYRRFLQAFPTVQALADAPEEAVLKAWEGLGYYSRARNLHKAAKMIAGPLSGEFPHTAMRSCESCPASAITPPAPSRASRSAKPCPRSTAT